MNTMHDVPADLFTPALVPRTTNVTAGTRFRETMPSYNKSNIYHVTYIPTNYHDTGNGQWPLILEWAGNGHYPEHCDLGYGMTAGVDFVWVSLPFILAEQVGVTATWWGNVSETVEYAKRIVPFMCQEYGACAEVVLAGFSRGSIAVNFIGLHDDAIAGLWHAAVAYAHYDGVGFGDSSSLERLSRLRGRPQFVVSERPAHGRYSVNRTRNWMKTNGALDCGQFTFMDTPFTDHNDMWILRPSAARDALRSWLKLVMNSSGATKVVQHCLVAPSPPPSSPPSSPPPWTLPKASPSSTLLVSCALGGALVVTCIFMTARVMQRRGRTQSEQCSALARRGSGAATGVSGECVSVESHVDVSGQSGSDRV